MDPYVLLVDDDDASRIALSAALRGAGRRVVCVSVATEAVNRMLGGEPPQAALLALGMPRLSGQQVLDAIADIPAIATIPIILLERDGHALATSRPVLHEPIDPDLVCAILEEILAQQFRFTRALREPPSDLLPRRATVRPSYQPKS
jgi:CheY-like chemotaxis protein